MHHNTNNIQGMFLDGKPFDLFATILPNIDLSTPSHEAGKITVEKTNKKRKTYRVEFDDRLVNAGFPGMAYIDRDEGVSVFMWDDDKVVLKKTKGDKWDIRSALLYAYAFYNADVSRNNIKKILDQLDREVK